VFSVFRPPPECSELNRLLPFSGSNFVTGTIPTQIGRLSGLSSLIVGTYCSFLDRPTFVDNSNLTPIATDDNFVSGSLPTQMALLTDLSILAIGKYKIRGSIKSLLCSLY
jgi:hypothetical protein